MLGKKKVDLGGWRGLCRNLDDMSTAYQCSCMTWKECLVPVGPQMLEVAIRPLRQNGAPPQQMGPFAQCVIYVSGGAALPGMTVPSCSHCHDQARGAASLHQLSLDVICFIHCM